MESMAISRWFVQGHKSHGRALASGVNSGAVAAEGERGEQGDGVVKLVWHDRSVRVCELLCEHNCVHLITYCVL